jgi:hypothetical protein
MIRRASQGRAVAFAVLFACTASTQALADGQACNESYEQGQVLRKDNKLLEARDMFRACVNTCVLDSKKKSCGEWLAQTERDIPTIVLSAKDGSGAVLVDVVVADDGKPLATKLDGRSVEVNPGVHPLSFEGPDGTRVEIQVVAEQGRKDTPVAATLGKPPTPLDSKAADSGPAASPPVTTSVPASPPLVDSTPPAGSPIPWKTIGLITAGVGVVGLGLGSVFGLQASSKKSDAGCDANSVCPNGAALNTLRDAHSAGDLSTAFFVAGGVLAAGGITMWALGRGTPVQVTPNVGSNVTGMMVRGIW